MTKELKINIHIYFPEASNRGSKIDLCEYFFITHSFQRRLSKANIKAYANDHQKKFNEAIAQKHKKKSQFENDLFFIVLDTDISPNRSNVGEVIKQIHSLNKMYKDNATLILSGRSFEVWLCMYGRKNYTTSFSSQSALNNDVLGNYEKKEKWYKDNAIRLYVECDKAVKSSVLSKDIVFKTTLIPPPKGHDLVNKLPDLSEQAVLKFLANTAPFTYFEHLIYVLKSYE